MQRLSIKYTIDSVNSLRVGLKKAPRVLVISVNVRSGWRLFCLGLFDEFHLDQFFAGAATNGNRARITRPESIFKFVDRLAGGTALFFHRKRQLRIDRGSMCFARVLSRVEAPAGLVDARSEGEYSTGLDQLHFHFFIL